MYSNWRGFCGALTLAASLITLGCGNSNNANVRAVNASPGLTGFTVQVGQTGIASSLPYGTEGVQPKGQYATTDSSGNYREIGAGSNQTVRVYQKPGTALASQKANFLRNNFYTVVTMSPAPAIHLLTLTDDNSAPNSGNYKLRFIDAGPKAGPVDVYITAVGAHPTGNPVIGNIQADQVTSYLQLAPGTLQVQITPHGSQSIVLLSASFSPAAGSIYSVFFLDPPDASSNVYGMLTVHDPINTGKTMSSGTK